MPELPEVETIRLGLSKKIIGLTIKKIDVLNNKSFQADPNLVRGKKVLKTWRRAKIIGIDLSDGFSLLIHLKMSGQLIWVGETKIGKKDKFIGGHPTPDWIGQMPNKATRVIFHFNDGSKLFFNDQRKFGWIRVSEKGKVKREKFMKDLGPEPLEREFTWQVLKRQLLKHKNLTVKMAIMDQQAISGIGNIYASEALFNAKLDPRTKVSELNDKQMKRLHVGIIKALEGGIKYGGSSRAHFVNEEGNKGLFLDYASVYQRGGLPCKICKTKIQVIRQGGRSTFYCPKCQK